jgi:hypothetical protein
LIDNGSDERFKDRIAVFDAVGSDAVDDRAEHRVRFFEMSYGFAHWNEIGMRRIYQYNASAWCIAMARRDAGFGSYAGSGRADHQS